MTCIWNIPKNERHCEYCLALCDEREMKNATSATGTDTVVSVPNNTIVLGGTEFFLIDGKLIKRTI
jgi:hypothetical protein